MLFPIRDSIAPRIAPVFNIGLIVAWWIKARGRLRQPASRYQVWYRH